jgi:hypothetical protein
VGFHRAIARLRLACALQSRELEGDTVMNIKALIATLVLGSSSIALADPSWTTASNASSYRDHDGDGDGDADDAVVRDHRVIEPIAQPLPAWRTSWMPLTQPARLLYRHVKSFEIGGNEGFSRLQIKSDKAETRVYQVRILFRDGKQQVVNTNTLLNANGPRYERTMTLNLECRAPIARIVVEGKTGPLGTFSILAA